MGRNGHKALHCTLYISYLQPNFVLLIYKQDKSIHYTTILYNLSIGLEILWCKFKPESQNFLLVLLLVKPRFWKYRPRLNIIKQQLLKPKVNSETYSNFRVLLKLGFIFFVITALVVINTRKFWSTDWF